MKIAMVQHNPTVGDFDWNARKIRDGYLKGVAQGADIVVAPELALWGYPPLDQLLVPDMIRRHKEECDAVAVANANSVTPLVFGAVRKNCGSGMPLFNTAIYAGDGYWKCVQDKQLLPKRDVFDEPRYFEPGRGDSFYFYSQRKKCAIRICQDIWYKLETESGQYLYQDDPIAQLEGENIDVLIVPNASPYYWGKGNVRFELVSGIAKRLGCVVVYVNQVGGNDELVFDGRSFAVNAQGKCIAAARAFEEDVVVFDTEGPEVPYPNDLGDISQLYDSLVLSVRDYAEKCGYQKALLGLSGGVDSALVLAIATDALGAENMEAVMMPYLYTSKISLEDARAEADALGVEYSVLPITNIVDAFGKLLAGEFLGYEEDVTEENIQARIRGTLLMAISNKKKSLLLTTGNKSEMSVGYTTLYGDMAGGFAPIKDVPKMLVYALARYRNTISPVIPERVLTRAPSAELAPDQKDQDSLPPYEMLDVILKLHIERNMSAEEIVQEKGFALSVVKEVLRKVERAEYKRRQSPPGTKVSEKAFGGGRRYPIAAKGVSD